MKKEEILKMSYEDLVNYIDTLTVEEIIELSREVGYPVFTRLCMGKLRHKFVLLQDGAAAIIKNDKNEILMQRRKDNGFWGLPGGCQELGETFADVVIREVKEETNLDVENPKLIGIISGMSRKKSYPNGDVVINNTALYLVDVYSGEIKLDHESKELKFFALDSLPKEQHDPDLINYYKNYI